MRLLLLFWIALLGIAHATATAFPAPENRVWDFFNIGYDAIGHDNVDYDAPEKSFSTYDVASSRAPIDNKRRTEAQRASLASFA